MIPGPQKQCSRVSDLQIHKYSIGQTHVKIHKHKYINTTSVKFADMPNMLYLSETLTYAVFVYFYLCICVFASQTTGNIVFEVLVSLPFRKYMVCMV